MSKILNWLRLPDADDAMDLDDPATTLRHAKIIEEKKFLRRYYNDIYALFTKEVQANPSGHFVELGSGGGFLKKITPQIITSDLLRLPHIDLVFNALHLPFRDKQIDAFFMCDVFHHVKDPATFLKELSRCLKPSAKVIMIEPANTLWGRFVYQKFHHEDFNPSGAWELKGEGPMTSANGALPWIVFVRDRIKFEQKFLINETAP